MLGCCAFIKQHSTLFLCLLLLEHEWKLNVDWMELSLVEIWPLSATQRSQKLNDFEFIIPLFWFWVRVKPSSSSGGHVWMLFTVCIFICPWFSLLLMDLRKQPPPPPLPIRSKTSNQNYFEASLHRVSITRMNDSAVSVRRLVAVTTLYQYSQYWESAYICFHTFTHTVRVSIGTLFFTDRWFCCQRSLKPSVKPSMMISRSAVLSV